jgi:hypothetical protein
MRPGAVVRETDDVGALLIQANAYALTLQYQTRGGRCFRHRHDRRMNKEGLGPSLSPPCFTQHHGGRERK